MSTLLQPALSPTLVSAGAGSGKTYHLTELVVRALDPNTADGIAVDGLTAVTYTCKAALELEARLRRTLVNVGALDRARELPLAYVGTVHAVCLRLLSEYAIDAGLSPLLHVVPGEEATLLRQALEWGLPAELCQRIEHLAGVLEIGWDDRVQRHDWLTPVQEIMTLARSNRIAADALPAMGERAASRLLTLMGPALADEQAIERELAEALAHGEALLGELETGQKNTQQARETLRHSSEALAAGQLAWSRWIALQKLNPGKAGKNAVAALIQIAEQVDRHPRLQRQLQDYIRATYEAARLGLAAYERWKQARRLLDFVDMVDRTLQLLDVPAVHQELAARLQLCVVDEFQDTSPLQLALFVRLHALAGRSTWVGDRKQCIFEYAGADPALMEAVSRWVAATGGRTPSLLDNWRSRPELVHAVSELFGAAFSRYGHPREELVLQPRRASLSALAALPPLGVWYLDCTNVDQDAETLALGVQRLLDASKETMVLDRESQQPRPLQPADIAILVATNEEAGRLAVALERRNVRVALARSGLLDTPEGTLLQAALSYLADGRDERARAVLEALTGFAGTDPDTWLEQQLGHESARRAAVERGEQPPLVVPSPVVARLLELRAELPLLAPSEALDATLSVLDMASCCARWPDPDQRLANLDALRALARSYEAQCGERREAASLSGLLGFFASAREPSLRAGEASIIDRQHTSHGTSSVTVTTYHRAKGLEWPVVVLASLHRKERRDAFSVLPAATREGFDPNDPLGGRWIRYWPWPYGSQQKAPLAERVEQSLEGSEVREREARERLRLLYVGFTRARDHLVLAVRLGKQGPRAAWLDELSDDSGAGMLELPATFSTDCAPVLIRGARGTVYSVPARSWLLQPAAPPPSERSAAATASWFATASPKSTVASYRIAPSRASRDWPSLAAGGVGATYVTGSRLPLGSESPNDWSVVGDSLHAFLAADLPGLSEGQRHERARRLLEASELLALIEPAALVRASDDLRCWANGRWPGAVWHREVPVAGIIDTDQGHRRVEGTIDLLLELDAGVVLIDHKSYPGRQSTWREKAREYVPQLAAYAEVLRMAGHQVLSQWLSYPVSGGVVEILSGQGAIPNAAVGGQ
ncbi:MAG: hypothetical protein RL685_5532 [Pseudomonadota bacterium]|jgi:ATP-dependent exoDNAse (exonuclease V) beta subunit